MNHLYFSSLYPWLKLLSENDSKRLFENLELCSIRILLEQQFIEKETRKKTFSARQWAERQDAITEGASDTREVSDGLSSRTVVFSWLSLLNNANQSYSPGELSNPFLSQHFTKRDLKEQ